MTELPAAPPTPAPAPPPNATPSSPRPRTPWLTRALVGLALGSLFLVPLQAENAYRMSIYGQCLALAILALGVDLVWGYTGLLSLGQGLYFAIGAYSMAYCLTLQFASASAPPGVLAPPSFMRYTGLAPSHPDYVEPIALKFIAPLANVWVALAVAVIVPAAVAALFGAVAFRLRIRGVYFSLITQALVLTMYTLVLNQQAYTGGVVGINELADLKLLGIPFATYDRLYWLTACVLVVCFVGVAGLLATKFGKLLTAIRDNEYRVMALGYNTAAYKVCAFALAGALSGLAGALFVPINGKMGPTFLGVAFSIEAVVFVAVGGRGTLIGAVLGTILVRLAYTDVAVAFPNLWPIVLGGLFVGVVLFLPDGILGLLQKTFGWLKSKFAQPPPGA